MNNSRFNFIKSAPVAAINLPQLVSQAMGISASPKKMKWNTNDVVLFQGDSITDKGRSRTDVNTKTAQALGYGYAFLTAGQLLAQYPQANLQFFNRGISGNKVYQLADRWQTDALDLKPNLLSILVGVNDFWHTLTQGYKGTVDTYKDDYKKLLDRTKQALPDTKLIIGEPFCVWGGRAISSAWFPKFADYRLAAREVASLYHAAFIPYQSIFEEALQHAPAAYWTLDGVHPSIAGEALMAEAWLQTLAESQQ